METAVTIQNGNEAIRAILHEPAVPAGLGVVFLHGWSGNRLGPHRMFVTLARRLEALGIHGLRIDFRGRGDSDGATEAASIAGMMADAGCAVDFLMNRASVRRVVLLGICSGGKVAIGTAATDPRIGGLVLWSAEAMGYLRHRAAKSHKSFQAILTYLKKLARPESWLKILTGRVNTRMVRKAIATDETPREAEQVRESALLDRFKKFKGGILFIYGGNDPDTRFAAGAYTQFCAKQGIQNEFHEIAEANHSFYSLLWEREVLKLTELWFEKQVETLGRKSGGIADGKKTENPVPQSRPGGQRG